MKLRIRAGILVLSVCSALILSTALFIQKADLYFNAPSKPYTFAAAQSSDPPKPLILNDEQDKYSLGPYLELLEEPGGELTIEEVSSPEFASRFTPNQVEVPNFGFTNSAYWVRLNLHNETFSKVDWLLEQGFANMQFADLFIPSTGGEGFTVKQTGVLRPVETRDILHPRLIFELAIPPQTQQAIHLRFQNGASMTLPLTLWTQAAFLNHSSLEQTSMGIFYGIMIGLFFYNLFLL
jgi:hypothetical protein